MNRWCRETIRKVGRAGWIKGVVWGQNEAWAATRRPDGGYRFVPRGRLGVPGTPRLSEFIRGLHAPGKTFREPPREIPRDAAWSDGTRSHRPGCGGRALSFIGGGAGNFWGEFVFLSQFSSVFCSSSSRLKSVLNTCAHKEKGVAVLSICLWENASNFRSAVSAPRKCHQTLSSSWGMR